VLRQLFAIVLTGVASFGQPVISTIAGSEFVFPRTPLPALNAPLPGAFGVIADSAGNLIFSDGISRVYRVTPSGVLTVIAGNGFMTFSGDGGPATAASLNEPRGLAMDALGNLYIADFGNYRVRKISANGIIITLAGSGQYGYGGDNGPARAALLKPSGVAVDSAGNVYIADPNNNRIRRVSAAGVISTAAGNGEFGYSGDGGNATAASLFTPYGLAVDSQGNLYIADSGNYRIRKVSPSGIISTLAGDGGFDVSGDGVPATAASLGFVTAVTTDASGNVFIAGNDQSGQGSTIRKVSVAGIINRIAGTGNAFSGDGSSAIAASLNDPQGLALDSAQNLYIGDYGNRRIRKVSSLGIITTVAGSASYGFSGDGGSATAASLTKPDAVAVDAAGNVYIADTGNNRIRKVSPNGIIVTIAGNGLYGYSGDDGPATEASLNSPEGVAVDSAGTIFVVDSRNLRIRKISTTTGIITTIAGNGQCCYLGDGGPATAARLAQPYGVAVDLAGSVYIADTGNNTIRKISPSGNITTVAGGGPSGTLGDGGQATNAALDSPFAVAVDLAGNLYIAEFNSRIRKVSPSGIITTIAGNGQVFRPVGVALGIGNLYIDDAGTNSIRRISPDGLISTVAGNGLNSFSGDGGPATAAALNHPDGVAVDASGNIYIADTFNNRVRKVLGSPPALTYSPESFSYAGSVGGAPAPPQELLISTAAPYLSFSVSVSTSDGAPWLAVDVSSGTTPRAIQVIADPSVLMDAGTYSGQINIESPLAVGSPISIPVSFSVAPGLPPLLAIDQSTLTFTYPAGARAFTQPVGVRNAGGGSLDFSVTVDPGAPWLIVVPSSGTISAAAPVTPAVTADPSGLAAGTYTGSFTVTGGAAITVPVIMNVSMNASAFLLSQAGLSFTAVEQGGTVPPQNFAISNLGNLPLNPVVGATTVRGDNWLSPTLTADASGGQSVEVNVDPSRLKQGRYYGAVSVGSSGAANSPQVATAMLEVLPAGTNVGAALLPNELTFNATVGTGSPSSQVVLIYNLTAKSKTFLASGGALDLAPRMGTVFPDQPTQLLVQPDATSLAPGTYQSSITLQFDDGAVRVIRVTVAVSSSSGSAGALSDRVASPTSCQPSQLLPSIKSLGTGFAVPAGWPVAIQAQVQDDCGAPMESGSVIAEFSNGDPPLSLVPISGGRWDATWQTRSNTTAVTLTVRATSADKQLTGLKQVAGGFGTSQTPPVISSVTNSASNLAFQALTPGGLVNVSGSLLADQPARAPSVPLSTMLANTIVLIAGQAMPIALTDASSVAAIIPYGIEINTQQQIVLGRDDTLSLPVRVNLASASPAIFTTDGHQGMIVDTNGNLVDGSNPARSGDTITLYCTGLGELNEIVTPGDYGPAASSTKTLVAVSIGGQNAKVTYSGLAAQLVGIYFVQATVPDGIPGGDVSVTLTSLSTPPATSPTVITSIAN